MSRWFAYALTGLVALVHFGSTPIVRAQQVDVGGLGFIDYFYTLSSPVEDEDELHGFTYRRLFLTADFTLSESFFGRARIEANEETLGSSGPVPFVKDLWLAWRYHGDHEARIGVMPPPVFELPEEVWGYRSLEKTILDFQGINSSRDFGVRFDGPLGGDFGYAVMFGNGDGVRPESDPYKRGYALISYEPESGIRLSGAVDRAGYEDPGDGSTRVSAFGGFRSNRLNFGAEAYWYRQSFDVGENFRSTGLSVFARYLIADAWEFVGRVDLANEEFGEADADNHFVVLGASYTPVEGVKLIPNLWFFNESQADALEALARMTVEISF